jgi:Bax protein
MKQMAELTDISALQRIRRFKRTHGVLFLLVSLALAVLALAPREGEEKMPDFRPLQAAERKMDFFDFLAPIVASVNARVAEDKLRLDTLASSLHRGDALTWLDAQWVRRLAETYEVPLHDGQQLTDDVVDVLKRRVDVVPESLVLVQAAKESGWGTSRFAVQGNNLFGQRCYRPGCGIRPKNADSGRFGVAQFDSVRESVSSYIRNLNTHPEYRGFRDLRERLRDSGEPLKPMLLVEGLTDYSERGTQYISELKALMRQNGLIRND